MGWLSMAAGALAIVAAGGAVVYFGSRFFAAARDAVGSLRDLFGSVTGSIASGAKKILDAPGEALGYLQESADYNRNPDRDAQGIDPVTGRRFNSLMRFDGKTIGQTQREDAEAEAKKRASESKDATIERLKAQKALIEGSGQEFIIDLSGGGKKVTLAEVKAQLAALGVT